jgi:hypothetical protein
MVRNVKENTMVADYLKIIRAAERCEKREVSDKKFPGLAAFPGTPEIRVVELICHSIGPE